MQHVACAVDPDKYMGVDLTLAPLVVVMINCCCLIVMFQCY
jgi:hypothetical protein